jgi:hypothetical protein
MNTKNTKNTKKSVKTRSPLDEQIEVLEAQMVAQTILCNEWEHHVHEDFNGYGCFAILNMHAYHLNVARGFGSGNDESNYQSEIARDKDGTWLECAMHWVKLSLECSRIRSQIRVLKNQRGDYTKHRR